MVQVSTEFHEAVEATGSGLASNTVLRVFSLTVFGFLLYASLERGSYNLRGISSEILGFFVCFCFFEIGAH